MHTPVSVKISPTSEQAKPKVRSVRVEKAEGGYIVHNEHEGPMEMSQKPMVMPKLSHVKKHLDNCFNETEE